MRLTGEVSERAVTAYGVDMTGSIHSPGGLETTLEETTSSATMNLPHQSLHLQFLLPSNEEKEPKREGKGQRGVALHVIHVDRIFHVADSVTFYVIGLAGASPSSGGGERYAVFKLFHKTWIDRAICNGE